MEQLLLQTPHAGLHLVKPHLMSVDVLAEDFHLLIIARNVLFALIPAFFVLFVCVCHF